MIQVVMYITGFVDDTVVFACVQVVLGYWLDVICFPNMNLLCHVSLIL